jgi:membrane-bound serine protease (ClpP class)
MDYSVVFAFSMLAVGLALILAEMFIPSGGVISFLSVVCIGVSIYGVYTAWFGEHPDWFWWYVGSVMGLIPATLGTALFLLARTKLGSRVLLEAPKLEDVTPYLHELEERKQLIGKVGKSLTLMAPGGLVIVENRRLHAETEGQMLDPETPIKVIAVKANRVVVRPYEAKPGDNGSHLMAGHQPAEEMATESGERAPAYPDAKLAETTGESKPAPLDFEIPEG